jgi:hypothetical protein
MTDRRGNEHGWFCNRWDYRVDRAEAYCVCGEYETGTTMERAMEALETGHLRDISRDATK